MEGQEVDAATIAEVVEADLDPRQPPIGPQRRGGGLDDVGMDRIDQSVELLALPSDRHVDRCLERVSEPHERTNLRTRQLPALDA